MPMPDMYQALDKGVVDGVAAPWEAIHGFRLYEVAKNYTMVPFYAAYFSLCANKAEDPEPAEGRARRDHERQRPARLEVLGQATSSTPPSRASMERVKAGKQRDQPLRRARREVARWQKTAGEPLWDEWVKKMEGKGHKEARDVLNYGARNAEE